MNALVPELLQTPVARGLARAGEQVVDDAPGDAGQIFHHAPEVTGPARHGVVDH